MYVRNYTQGHIPREINGAPTRDYVPFSRPEPILIPDNYHGELLRSAEREQSDPAKETSPRETSAREASMREVPVRETLAEGREAEDSHRRESLHPEGGRTFPGTLLEGKEDTLLLCAVGILLFAGQNREAGWREEDLALLLILLLLIT